MRKIQIVALALFAVFAFSAFVGSPAFAASKILFKGENITAALSFEIKGSLLLEDTKAAVVADVLCTGILDGTIEPGGELGYIEALLTAAGTLVAGEGTNDLIECEDDKNACTNPVDVEAGNFKWHFEILLDLEPALEIFLAHFLNAAEIAASGEVGVGQPRYIVDCNTIIGLVLDTCEGLSSTRLWNAANGELLGSFNSLPDSNKDGAESETTECTQGGVGSGVLVSVTLAGEEDTEASAGTFVDPSEAGTFSVSP